MMKTLKSMALFVIASLLVLTSTASAEASAYTGYNSIGSYYQYQYQGAYQGGYTWQPRQAMGGEIQLANPYYNYGSTPRAGGWFGGGSGWITGLREPYYGCVAPTHYSSFSRPTCGGGYSGGGNFGGYYGYPETTTTRIREESFRFSFY